MPGFNHPVKQLVILSQIALLGLCFTLPAQAFSDELLAHTMIDELPNKPPRIYVKFIDLAYQAIDNAKYSVAWHSTYFPKAEPHQVTMQHDALFNVSSMVDLEPNLMLNADLYATITTESQVLRGIFSNTENTKQRSKFIDFKQLYVMYRLHSYDLSAGKILISNGMAEIASITDILNEENFIGYQDPITVGAWQLRADYYNSMNDQLSIILIPLELRDNILPNTSRFYGNTDGYVYFSGQDPALFTNVIFQPSGYSDSTPKNWSWYGKYSGTRDNIDFFGGVYYGSSLYNVARTVATHPGQNRILEIKKPHALSLMGGASHVIQNVRIYGETLTQWTFGGADDSFLQMLAGIHVRDARVAQRIHFDDVSYTLELGFDKKIKAQNDQTYYFSSDASRKSIDILTGEVVLKKDEQHSGFFGLSLNYKDKGRSFFIGSRYDYTDTLYGQLSLHLYGGPDSSTFGRWRDNRSLEFSMGYDF